MTKRGEEEEEELEEKKTKLKEEEEKKKAVRVPKRPTSTNRAHNFTHQKTRQSVSHPAVLYCTGSMDRPVR